MRNIPHCFESQFIILQDATLTQDALAQKEELSYTPLTKIESEIIVRATTQTVIKK